MDQSRRSAIGQMISLAAVSQLDVILPKVWAADPDYVIAEISSGKIRGVEVDGVKIFKGIPYGGPAMGKGRFIPPSVAPKWTGVRDALKFGPTAPQLRTSQPPGVPAQGEDCLVLNIFTQGLGYGRRPVMVWLHGGGFQEGSASEPAFNGFDLARVHDVVLVSVNHRLNVLGATYLGEVAGPEFAFSGAVGVLDLVASLQWVRTTGSTSGRISAGRWKIGNGVSPARTIWCRRFKLDSSPSSATTFVGASRRSKGTKRPIRPKPWKKPSRNAFGNLIAIIVTQFTDEACHIAPASASARRTLDLSRSHARSPGGRRG